MRADGYRFDVDAGDPANGGTTTRRPRQSRRAASSSGRSRGTELYVNAGFGFHSNDARGATITRDPVDGRARERGDAARPREGRRGRACGPSRSRICSRRCRCGRSSLASELVFVGDAGTTEAGRPSHRYGVEFANYYSPRRWLTFDGDVSLSRTRDSQTSIRSATAFPGSVETVVSAGATVDSLHNVFGSVRWRYFGPRPLIEDDSVSSKATRLVNLEAGYKLARRDEGRRRCVQPARRRRQRHRLLLCVAPAEENRWRASRTSISIRHCRVPHA